MRNEGQSCVSFIKLAKNRGCISMNAIDIFWYWSFFRRNDEKFIHCNFYEFVRRFSPLLVHVKRVYGLSVKELYYCCPTNFCYVIHTYFRHITSKNYNKALHQGMWKIRLYCPAFAGKWETPACILLSATRSAQSSIGFKGKALGLAL
jgi:hypothetical protein